MILDPRVVLVTGAAGALGSAYVRLLTDAGCRVVACDVGADPAGQGADPGGAHDLVLQARDRGAEVVAVTASVARPEGAAAAVAAALDSYGRLDAVVNNAGFLRDHTLSKLPRDDVVDVVEVHLRATVLVSQAALPALRRSGAGRLVHTASAAVFGSFGQTNYAAAKLGIVGFSRSLALEEGRHGIGTNVVAPFEGSRMTGALTGSEEPPLGPDQVAPVVGYLSSAECTLTGETFTVGGGHIARLVLGLTPGWHGPTDRPPPSPRSPITSRRSGHCPG